MCPSSSLLDSELCDGESSMLPGSGGEKGSCCSPFFDLLGDNRLGGRAGQKEGERRVGQTEGGREGVH